MTGEPKFCQAILSSPILPLVIEKLAAAFDIKQEALFVICNIGCLGEETCTRLVEHGALQKVVAFLHSSDIELLCTVLSFCEMCLRLAEKGQHIFEENGGVDRLEGLEYHANEEVRTRANYLLETYFYLDSEVIDEG